LHLFLVSCVTYLCRESGVVLFQSHASFVLGTNSEISAKLKPLPPPPPPPLPQAAPDSPTSAAGASKKKSLSLFAKRVTKQATPKEMGDARSNKDFISDFVLSLDNPLKISVTMHPFQLELSRRDTAATAVERPRFRSVVSVCSFPFPLSTLKCRKTTIAELQRPFPTRHIPRSFYLNVNQYTTKNRMVTISQRPPFMFAGIADLQLTQDIIELHQYKKLLVTASYLCEENRHLLLTSSYLGCISRQHG
jgi:hypothetical protein